MEEEEEDRTEGMSSLPLQARQACCSGNEASEEPLLKPLFIFSHLAVSKWQIPTLKRNNITKRCVKEDSNTRRSTMLNILHDLNTRGSIIVNILRLQESILTDIERRIKSGGMLSAGITTTKLVLNFLIFTVLGAHAAEYQRRRFFNFIM